MAKDKTKRLRPSILQEDLDAYAALKVIAGYSPSNANYALTSVDTSNTAMTAKQTDEVQKQAAADAARDDSVAAEWDFHDMILGVKNQVKAQFGESSNELQSLGLKKKSEYKRGGGRPAAPSDGGNG